MNFEELLARFVDWAIVAGKKLLAAALVVFVGYLLIKWLTKRMENSKFAKKNDPTVVRILQNFTRIGLYIVLVISVVAILGVPMASVITVIASAGVAIGLALQGALSNLAGGIMILLFRPFRLGDFVEVAGATGTVTDIGIFYTTVTTGDNRTAVVPNGAVMGATILNYSVNDTRRVDFVFNVAYGTDVERVKAILLEEANRHSLVLRDKEPFCRLSKQAESSLDFTLRVWVKSSDYWTVNFDILEAVNARFAAEGIEIPFNQLDVNLKK